MDISTKELALHIYGLVCTFILILMVQHSLFTIHEYKQHRLSSTQCCKKLNIITPIKTFFHLQLPLVLLVSGHPFIYLIHLPVMIWSWTALPNVRYERIDIRRPRVLALYRNNLLFLLGFFTLVSVFHGTPLANVMFDKIAEWKIIWKRQLKAASNRAENLLFRAVDVELVN